jgi:hypothetical protein
MHASHDTTVFFGLLLLCLRFSVDTYRRSMACSTQSVVKPPVYIMVAKQYYQRSDYGGLDFCHQPIASSLSMVWTSANGLPKVGLRRVRFLSLVNSSKPIFCMNQCECHAYCHEKGNTTLAGSSFKAMARPPDPAQCEVHDDCHESGNTTLTQRWLNILGIAGAAIGSTAVSSLG